MPELRDPEARPTVVVLIPVLGRPHRARPVADSVVSTSWAAVHFIATDGDKREIAEIRKLQRSLPGVGLLIVEPRARGDYAFKVNRGVLASTADWYFQGADDLTFHPGWLDEALSTAATTGARVIGTNDLANPRVMRGRHSTHSLVARSYIEEVGTVDEPGKMLHEGYWHGFVDDELVTCAKQRREYAHAAFSRVQHHHPTTSSDVPLDATYERALNRNEFALDRRIFLRRQRLWRPGRRQHGVRSIR